LERAMSASASGLLFSGQSAEERDDCASRTLDWQVRALTGTSEFPAAAVVLETSGLVAKRRERCACPLRARREFASSVRTD